MLFPKVSAKLILVVLFLRHLLTKPLLFWKNQKGLAFFLNQFAADGIFPISTTERMQFSNYQRCQACSLCTFSCTAIQEGRAPASFEPKLILLGFGRSAHESEVFFDEWLPCVECGNCSVSCPNDVPVHEMALEVIGRRKQLAFRNKN